MARATTKKELLEAANTQFEALWNLLNAMSDEKKNEAFSFEDRDRNIRDVLIHLYEWHQLLLNWVQANKNGEAKSFLLAPYNWKTYPQMNIILWEKHQNTPYSSAIELLEKSHHDAILLIESFTNDELFTKQYFSWTGTTTLGSYCVSATASHYVWAIKKIKKHLTSN